MHNGINKLYTKLKNRMVSGEFQLNASTTKLAYLQSILYSISLATTRESLEEIRKECMDAGIIKKSKNHYLTSLANLTTFT